MFKGNEWNYSARTAGRRFINTKYSNISNVFFLYIFLLLYTSSVSLYVVIATNIVYILKQILIELNLYKSVYALSQLNCGKRPNSNAATCIFT
jgi:hypothetical protein